MDLKETVTITYNKRAAKKYKLVQPEVNKTVEKRLANVPT